MALHLLAVGKLVSGEFEMDIAMPPLPEPPEGELQRILDESHDTEDYENYLLDLEFWRSGRW